MFFVIMIIIIIILFHLTAGVTPLTIRSADGKMSSDFCKNGIRLIALNKQASPWSNVFRKRVRTRRVMKFSAFYVTHRITSVHKMTIN
jgi:hypothetical protein